MLLRFKVFRSAWEGVFLGSGQLPGTVEPWEADFPYHPGKSTWKPKSWGLVQMIFPFSIWWFSGFTLVLGEWTSPTCSIWSIISPTDLTWILAPFDASHWLAEWVVSYYDNTWDHPKCQKQVWILCGPNNGFLHCSLQRRIEGESWDFFKHKSSSSNFCQSLPYLWPCHTRYKSRQYHNRIQANLLSNSPKFSALQETNISYLPTWQKKKSSSNIPPVWGYVIVSQESIHNHLHCHGQGSPEVLYNRAWNSRFLISFRCGETSGKRHVFFSPNTRWWMKPTHLKNISKTGSFPQIGMKIKKKWNHPPVKISVPPVLQNQQLPNECVQLSYIIVV